MGLSTLHFDNYENLFAQLVGEKEFVLCPPGDSSKLCDGRLRKVYASWCSEDGSFQRVESGISKEAVMNYAAYDIDAPSAEYAERASKLRRTVVRVRAGEILYLPFGWWHQVRAVPDENGLCASMAYFFDPFFVRLQPKGLTKVGPLLPNPKYRKLCERLHLGDSSDEEGERDARGKVDAARKSKEAVDIVSPHIDEESSARLWRTDNRYLGMLVVGIASLALVLALKKK